MKKSEIAELPPDSLQLTGYKYEKGKHYSKTTIILTKFQL